MIGIDNDIGIMMRTVHDLYDGISSQNNGDSKNVEIRCSFLEVYNENIRDLLLKDNDHQTNNLALREDPVRGSVV